MSFSLLLVLMLVGGVVATVAASLRQGRQRRDLERQQTQQLEAALVTSRRAADEDVTRFGEELQHLDSAVAGHPLDNAMRQDYERALDAYENAKQSLEAVTRPEEIRHVTEILEDGRYAIACVEARVEGRPLPQKRPPCFFNPAHGPSTENVQWTPPGGVARDVPACAADAERVKAGADPYIRTVQVGAQRVPYWQGGPAYAPWAQGYYSGWRGSSMLGDIMIGSMIGSMVFNGMGGMMYGMGDGLGELGEGIGNGFEEIGSGIGEGFQDVGNGVGDMFDGIGNGFDSIGDGIGDAFNDIGDWF